MLPFFCKALDPKETLPLDRQTVHLLITQPLAGTTRAAKPIPPVQQLWRLCPPVADLELLPLGDAILDAHPQTQPAPVGIIRPVDIVARLARVVEAGGNGKQSRLAPHTRSETNRPRQLFFPPVLSLLKQCELPTSRDKREQMITCWCPRRPRSRASRA